MRSYRELAVVVECQKLGEADQIITLFTKNKGLIRAVAKGVRRTKSKFGGRLQLFSFVEVQLYPGKSLARITQVDSAVTLGPLLVDDFKKYNYACAMVELTRKILGEEYLPNLKLFELLVRGLRAVAGDKYPEVYIFNSFALRVLQLAGWLPNLNAGTEIPALYQQIFKSYFVGDWERLDILPATELAKAQNFLISFIFSKTNIKLKSLDFTLA